MTYPFYIAHTTSGRTRIRWAGDATEKIKVRELAVEISQLDQVEHAQSRSESGSIIIEHDQVAWSVLEPRLTEQLPITFVSTPIPQRHTGIALLNTGLDKIDETLKDMNMDLNSLTVFLLVLLAVTQALRGQVMVSATSFLWYALSVASRARH